MWTGVQWTGTIGAGQTQLWFTWGWPAHRHVIWHIMSTTVALGSPEHRLGRCSRAGEPNAVHLLDYREEPYVANADVRGALRRAFVARGVHP